jgi:CO/xanthine dehydrogenase Mo-binding subunit
VTDIERGPGASCCGRAGETAASSIAFAFRSQTMVAHITEVEVSRRTGHVWAKRTVECGMLHSLSRALHEEVRFDTEQVTSVNWSSSPTLTHAVMLRSSTETLSCRRSRCA